MHVLHIEHSPGRHFFGDISRQQVVKGTDFQATDEIPVAEMALVACDQKAPQPYIFEFLFPQQKCQPLTNVAALQPGALDAEKIGHPTSAYFGDDRVAAAPGLFDVRGQVADLDREAVADQVSCAQFVAMELHPVDLDGQFGFDPPGCFFGKGHWLLADIQTEGLGGAGHFVFEPGEPDFHTL